jgi:hypothetical protein
VSPFPGDDPQVAGVTQAGAVADEQLLGLVLGLGQHDRAVQLPRADQSAADRVLDVPAQAGAHVACDLDPLAGCHAELLDRGPVAVVTFLRRCHRIEFCHLRRRFR